MINLYQATSEEISDLARSLWQESFNQVASFEQAAQYCAREIQDQFRQEDGQSLFALVRVYRLMARSELPADLKQIAPSGSAPVWTLFGTSGDEPAWCDRNLSKAHKVCAEESSPMFKLAAAQINLKNDAPIDTEAPIVAQRDNSLVHYFYIAEAQNSPVIVQDSFAMPYGIRSVVGFGCKFMSGNDCLILAFAKDSLTIAEALRFVALSPFVPTLLAHFDRKTSLWA